MSSASVEPSAFGKGIMARSTAWQSQTKWLSDLTYDSPKVGGIWNGRVTRRDREMTVTDSDYLKVRKGLCDAYGNFPPRTPWEFAKVTVERALREMDACKRDRITPGMKWRIVDLLAAGRGKEAIAMLSA